MLHHGDCFDVMPSIADNSVDMILADLPYGTTQNKWDSVLPLDALWKQYWRVAKPNAAVVLTAQCPFDKVLGVSCLDHLKYEWTWEKTQPTGHLNANRAPMKCHENILVFCRGRATYNPQKTSGHRRVQSTSYDEDSANYGQQIGGRRYDSDERYPRDVLLYPKDKQRSSFHPTQKPVALLEYFIRTYTNEGDTVLDNTMGSGSTGVAALACGRKFIGIERDEKYFVIASDRLNRTAV
jgi:DNA modification methylase